MADKDLEIRVRSSADLSALKQAQAAVDDLGARTVKINRAAIDADTARFAKATGLPLPGTPTVPFGEEAGGAGVSGLTSVAAAMERHTMMMGANLTRARQEAIILARELATGVPITRTLGSLLGSLGLPIAGAAIAVGSLGLAIKKAADEEIRINEELNVGLDTLTKSAHQWLGIAREATSYEDVVKLAADTLPTIEKAHDNVNKKVQEQNSLWGRVSDTLSHTAGWLGAYIAGQTEISGNIGRSHKEATDAAVTLEQQTKKTATTSKNLAEEFEAAFEEEKTKPIGEAIKQATNKIDELTAKQRNLNKESATYQQDWVNLGKQIDVAHTNLGKILALDERRNAVLAAQAKQTAKDIREGPITFQDQMIEKQKQHAAIQAAAIEELREFDSQGGPKTPEERARVAALQAAVGPQAGARFALEIEREELRRQQALAGTLVPRGEENRLGAFLGAEGEVEYRRREMRLNDINAQLRGMDTTGGKLDPSSQAIVQVLEKIYQQWQ